MRKIVCLQNCRENRRILLMIGAAQNLPYSAQWLGLVVTLLGSGVGVASLYWAWKAARRALDAKKAAEQAELAATRAARVTQLSDVIADMQELQAMLARLDFLAIASKANLLRGRIVRFKAEAYNELGDQEKKKLDLAREQLHEIAQVAATSRAGEKHKAGRIQLGYGDANEALNQVCALHGQSFQGD